MEKNEQIYLSALCNTFDKLTSMIPSFSDEQLQIVIPTLNYVNDILNKEATV